METSLRHHVTLLATAVTTLASILATVAPAAGQEPGPVVSFPTSQSPTVAPMPDGGFLAGFIADAVVPLPFGSDAVLGRTLSTFGLGPDGEPMLPATPRVEADPEGGAQGERLAGAVVAPAGPSSGLLLWSQDVPGLEVDRLLVARLAEEGIGEPALLTDCPVQGRDLVAAGSGYWAVWKQLCPDARIVARRLDPAGRPAGPEVPVSLPADEPGSAVDAAGLPDGGVVVTWVGSSDVGRRIFARTLHPDGTGEGAPFLVSPFRVQPVFPPFPFRPRVARLPGDLLLFAWQAPDGRVVTRRFSRGGDALEPAVPVGGGEEERGFLLGLATTSSGFSAVFWSPNTPTQQGASPCSVRIFDLAGAPVTGEIAMGEACSRSGSDLAFSETGVLVAGWMRAAGASEGLWHDVFFRSLSVPAAEPPGEPVVSAEYPDFRFWVRIGGPGGRLGQPEPLCIPETVCLSGAVPGRTEVFLRIVGPKPNGRLWPTLVKFSTSLVEVWIEQVSTGEQRYYRLPAARPGFDELPGLFDRTGFEP